MMNINNKIFNNSNSAKNISFGKSTSGFKDKAFNVASKVGHVDNSGSFHRMTFMSLALVFLLGARYMQSRDKDEKREVITRDFSAVVAAVWGVPMLKKGLGQLMDKGTGLSITTNKKAPNSKSPIIKALRKISPDEGKLLAGFDNIKSWYCYDKDSGQKIENWFEHLSKKVNPEKAFTILGDKVKDPVEKIFGKDFSGNFVEKMKEAVDSSDKAKKDAIDDFIKVVSNKDNKLVSRAKLYRAVPQAVGIGLTIGLLGCFLPWFNIQNTRSRYINKDETNKKAAQVA